jgi:hypothetical protein
VQESTLFNSDRAIFAKMVAFTRGPDSDIYRVELLPCTPHALLTKAVAPQPRYDLGQGRGAGRKRALAAEPDLATWPGVLAETPWLATGSRR